MEPATIDTRAAPRTAMDLPVSFMLSGQTATGRLRDLSLHGALISLDTPIGDAIGRPCRLWVQHHDGRQIADLNALVVRTEKRHIGLKLLGVGDAKAGTLFKLADVIGQTSDEMNRHWPDVASNGDVPRVA